MTHQELNRITILVPGKRNEHAVRRLEKTFDMVAMDAADPALITPELAEKVKGVAAFTGISADFMDKLPNLKIVASFGVGYDGIDVSHAGKHGVMVTNTPDVLTEEVADTALGLLLNSLREFARAENYLREGRWVKEGPYRLTPGTLRGRRAGIFGMGRIGQAIARRLEAFGLPVAYHNRRRVEDLAYEYHDTLLGLAKSVDTLICVVPGGESTAKAINADVLKALGPHGVFINIGRGTAVDEAALTAALADGTIFAAGLDVFADEPNVPQALLDVPNATLLPHVGSASIHTRNGMADLVVDNLVSWFARGEPITAVAETAHVKSGK